MGVNKTSEYFLLILAATLWASAFPLIKIAVASIPPAEVAAGRSLVGLFFFALIVLLFGSKISVARSSQLKLAGLGLVGFALPFFLQNQAEVWVPSRDAAILIGLVPLFTVVLARLVLHTEKIRLAKILGLGLGFSGVVVLVGPSALVNVLGAGTSLGHLLLLLAAVSYSGQIVLSRTITDVPPLQITFFALLWAALFSTPLALSIGDLTPGQYTDASLGAVIILGAISTAAAAYLTYRLVHSLGPGAVAHAVYLVPPIGILLGNLTLGEPITPDALAAAGLILFGLVVAEGAFGKYLTDMAKMRGGL